MIKPLYFFFFVIVCLLGLMACSAKPQDKFKNLTADEFDRLIQDEDVQRLDVRTVAEYSEGHIPGSLYPVAVYCKSGRRSRNAARILTNLGYKVYNLDKGFDNWKEYGKEVER